MRVCAYNFVNVGGFAAIAGLSLGFTSPQMVMMIGSRPWCQTAPKRSFAVPKVLARARLVPTLMGPLVIDVRWTP